MAIQAQMYPDSSKYPTFIAPEWGSGGGAVGLQLHNETWVNQRNAQALDHQSKISNETPSFSYTHSLNVDQFILDQGDRLRHVLREQRKRDVAALLKKLETRTSFLLNQKNEEIAKAKSNTSQLESLLLKLQAENLTWQQIAKQNELHVISLSNTLHLMQQQQHPNDVVPGGQTQAFVEDAESCCDEVQLNESGLGNGSSMVCRVCQNREVGVVVLPCRHLCLCVACGPMIDLCPVCRAEKKGSVEALFC